MCCWSEHRFFFKMHNKARICEIFEIFYGEDWDFCYFVSWNVNYKWAAIVQCSRLLVRDSTRQAKFPSNFLRTWTSGKRNFPIGVKLHSQHRVAEVIDSHIVFLSFNTFYILIFWVVFLFTMSVCLTVYFLYGGLALLYTISIQLLKFKKLEN